jgi:hypothetical protein
MIRKTFLAAALTLGAVGLLGSVAELGRAADPAAAPYVHIVIFRLKPDAPKGQADALIADAHSMLRKIPTVRDLRAGKPAEQATPEHAKKDYQVGLVLLFDDFAGLKTYLDHPLHTQYVDKHLKFVDMQKLDVFDFVNRGK